MSTVAEPRPNYHAHALTRGVLILRAVAASGKPTTLAILHERTELPKPTLVRLLSILVSEGLLTRVDDQPSFEIGPGVAALADALDRTADPATLARPYLDVVRTKLGQTGNLAVLDGPEVVHVCVVEADRPVRYSAHTGDRDEAWCTGLGRILLAHQPPDVVEHVVPDDPLPRLTPHTAARRADLIAAVVEAGDRGWAFDDQQSAEGLRCVAVPVIVDGECIAAISVSGPAAELGPDRHADVVAELTSAAAEVAADAGLVRQLRRYPHAGHRTQPIGPKP